MSALWTNRIPQGPLRAIYTFKEEPSGRWYIRRHGKGAAMYLIPETHSASVAKRAIKEAKEPRKLLRGDLFIVPDQPIPSGWFLFAHDVELAKHLRNAGSENARECQCHSYDIKGLFRVNKDFLLRVKMGAGVYGDFTSNSYYIKEF